MDWKDSMMSADTLAEIVRRTPRTSDMRYDIYVDILNVATAQAEISYKAGLKTAVDWLRETGVEIEADYYPHKGGKPKIYLAVYKHRLNKKCKEWGVK